uniref:Uncharacterized protein n=1 Tax=Timema douglasi TaxID=61478 RepID=A0A7R8ZFB2_TIMDO|nr:unnamed protein product [Timema douglasi]
MAVPHDEEEMRCLTCNQFLGMLTLEAGIVVRKMSPLLTSHLLEPDVTRRATIHQGAGWGCYLESQVYRVKIRDIYGRGSRKSTMTSSRHVKANWEKDVPEIDFRAFVFCSGLVCARANGQCSRNRLWDKVITVLDNQNIDNPRTPQDTSWISPSQHGAVLLS